MQGALFVKQPIMLCNLVLLLHYIIYRASYTVTIKVRNPPLKKDPSDLSVSACLVEVCARRVHSFSLVSYEVGYPVESDLGYYSVL